VTGGSKEEGLTLECILGTVASLVAGAALLVYLKVRRRQQRLAASGEAVQGQAAPWGAKVGQGVGDEANGGGQLPNGVPRTLSGRSYGRSDSRHSSGSDTVDRRRVAFARDGHTDSGLRQASIHHMLPACCSSLPCAGNWI
jgi:hypothetical protein